MAGKVVVRPVVNTVEFRPADGEEILNIARAFSVVGEFFVILKSQMFGFEVKRSKEIERRFLEFFVVFYIRSFLAEPLMFHLLEFNRSENEVAGRDFVSERLADLRDSERDLRPRRTLDVLEVYELALSRFGTEINFILRIFGNASRSLEHKVEVSYRRPV